MFRKAFIIPFLFVLHLAQAQQKAAPDPLTLADSLVHLVIEQEGLFTLYGGLKPISTVQHFSYPTDSLTGEYLDGEVVRKDFIRLSQALRVLSNDSIGYTVIPFKALGGNKRTFEILIYHKPSLERLISDKSDFFLKRGIIPGDNIEKILAIYEFEEKYDRLKAYGHLFGYPDHAVDFFVQAAKSNDEDGNFVERDFYQIPVANGQEGRFVYAIPKGYDAEDADMNLKAAAGVLLSRFREDWKAFQAQRQEGAGLENLNFLFYLSEQN